MKIQGKYIIKLMMPGDYRYFDVMTGGSQSAVSSYMISP
jgi:hypothetical protein